MEPKSLRAPSAQDLAALRAAVAGAAAEAPPKLSKPVKDVAGFRSTTWVAGPSLPDPPSVAPSPAPSPAKSPDPAPTPPRDALPSIQDDIASLRRMVAAMSESLRLLEARIAAQTPAPRG